MATGPANLQLHCEGHEWCTWEIYKYNASMIVQVNGALMSALRRTLQSRRLASMSHCWRRSVVCDLCGQNWMQQVSFKLWKLIGLCFSWCGGHNFLLLGSLPETSGVWCSEDRKLWEGLSCFWILVGSAWVSDSAWSTSQSKTKAVRCPEHTESETILWMMVILHDRTLWLYSRVQKERSF